MCNGIWNTRACKSPPEVYHRRATFFRFRGIVRALSTRGLAMLETVNGDFNSIYLRGIARTRVRRTCIYRDTGGGERVLVLKYPWPFCLSTLLLFTYARMALCKPDLSSAALRFLRITRGEINYVHGIYACWNWGARELKWRDGDIYLRWCICETRVEACAWFRCVIWLLVGLFMGFGTRWKYWFSDNVKSFLYSLGMFVE